MTKAKAMAAATKRWGDEAAIRYTRNAATKAEHEAASAELREHRARKPEPGTPEWRAWRKRESELMGIALSRQFEVGRINPYLGAFVIEGDGDSWEEAARKAKLID